VAGFVASLVAAPVPCLAATSRQYTLSLLLFALPGAVILAWFARTPRHEIGRSRGAFALTLGVLVPMGLVLDLLFARFFFTFENRTAVLGWDVPSLALSGWDRAHPIPVEEFAFYVLGFLAMLLFYIWAREDFLRPCTPAPSPAPEHVVRLACAPAAAAAALLGAAWLYKSQVAQEPGFPAYLAYLLAVPFLVTFTLLRVAAPLVNWQAFALTLSWVLGVSVLWEVSLAVPGGWWGYRAEAMSGLRIAAWHGLPVEAVLVWFLAALATVVLFEASRAFLHHPDPVWRRRLFGPGARSRA